MNVFVNTRKINKGKMWVEYGRQRIMGALRKRVDRISKIQMTLSDVNGPKGGVDKRCLIVLKLKGQADIIVEALHEQVHGAIDNAVNRVQTALHRRVNRGKDKGIHAGTRRVVYEY